MSLLDLCGYNLLALSLGEGWAREQMQMPGHATPGAHEPTTGLDSTGQLIFVAPCYTSLNLFAVSLCK